MVFSAELGYDPDEWEECPEPEHFLVFSLGTRLLLSLLAVSFAAFFFWFIENRKSFSTRDHEEREEQEPIVANGEPPFSTVYARVPLQALNEEHADAERRRADGREAFAVQFRPEQRAPPPQPQPPQRTSKEIEALREWEAELARLEAERLRGAQDIEAGGDEEDLGSEGRAIESLLPAEDISFTTSSDPSDSLHRRFPSREPGATATPPGSTASDLLDQSYHQLAEDLERKLLTEIDQQQETPLAPHREVATKKEVLGDFEEFSHPTVQGLQLGLSPQDLKTRAELAGEAETPVAELHFVVPQVVIDGDVVATGAYGDAEGKPQPLASRGEQTRASPRESTDSDGFVRVSADSPSLDDFALASPSLPDTPGAQTTTTTSSFEATPVDAYPLFSNAPIQGETQLQNKSIDPKEAAQLKQLFQDFDLGSDLSLNAPQQQSPSQALQQTLPPFTEVPEPRQAFAVIPSKATTTPSQPQQKDVLFHFGGGEPLVAPPEPSPPGQTPSQEGPRGSPFQGFQPTTTKQFIPLESFDDADFEPLQPSPAGQEGIWKGDDWDRSAEERWDPAEVPTHDVFQQRFVPGPATPKATETPFTAALPQESPHGIPPNEDPRNIVEAEMFIHDAIEYNQNEARQKSPNISSGFIMEEEMLSSEGFKEKPHGLQPKRLPSGDGTSHQVRTAEVFDRIEQEEVDDTMTYAPEIQSVEIPPDQMSENSENLQEYFDRIAQEGHLLGHEPTTPRPVEQIPPVAITQHGPQPAPSAPQILPASGRRVPSETSLASGRSGRSHASSNDGYPRLRKQSSLLSILGVTSMQEMLLTLNSLEGLSNAMRKAGLESTNLIFGIDYTASNKYQGEESFGGRSLHTIHPSIKNPYQQVISILGRTLAPFASTGSIPVFGFGDAKTSDWSVFSLKEGDFCRDLDEVLRVYNEVTPTVDLSGPTNFAPLIYQAMEICQKAADYHILVIIADGQVTNEKATRRAIVQACQYPLSIIVVGVGDGPWDMMRVFDESLPKRPWDNFHFVEFRDVIARAQTTDEGELKVAVQSLLEIPDQYRHICELGLLKKRRSLSSQAGGGRSPHPA